MSFDKKTIGVPQCWNLKYEFCYHAKLSLCIYNYLENTNFEFVELADTSMELMAFYLNHITFKALDPATGLTEVFRLQTETLLRKDGEDFNVSVDYGRLEFASTDAESGSSTRKRRKIEKDLFMGVGEDCFMECVPCGSSRDKFIGFNECPEYIMRVQELKAKGYNVGNIELLPNCCKDVEWLRLCAQLALIGKW